MLNIDNSGIAEITNNNSLIMKLIPNYKFDSNLSKLCLIYINNIDSLSEVQGSVRVCEIVEFINKYIKINILTGKNGEFLKNKETIIVNIKNIVSNRPYKTHLNYFYYVKDNKNSNNIIAKKFVDKNNKNKPIQSTSRSSIGSGIYGLYFKDTKDTNKFNKIYCTNPYYVQDKEHSESITIASIYTNIYIDKLINNYYSILKKKYSNIVFDKDIVSNLTLLWNIVFYRTNLYISSNILEKILLDYILDYIDDDNYIYDISTDSNLYVLPINYIFSFLGFDGLIGDDEYTNGWKKGCISFNLKLANKFHIGNIMN